MSYIYRNKSGIRYKYKILKRELTKNEINDIRSMEMSPTEALMRDIVIKQQSKPVPQDLLFTRYAAATSKEKSCFQIERITVRVDQQLSLHEKNFTLSYVGYVPRLHCKKAIPASERMWRFYVISHVPTDATGDVYAQDVMPIRKNSRKQTAKLATHDRKLDPQEIMFLRNLSISPALKDVVNLLLDNDGTLPMNVSSKKLGANIPIISGRRNAINRYLRENNLEFRMIVENFSLKLLPVISMSK